MNLLVVVVTITKLELLKQMLVVDDLNKWPTPLSDPTLRPRQKKRGCRRFREIRTALTGVQILRGSYRIVLHHSDKRTLVLLLEATLLGLQGRRQPRR